MSERLNTTSEWVTEVDRNHRAYCRRQERREERVLMRIVNEDTSGADREEIMKRYCVNAAERKMQRILLSAFTVVAAVAVIIMLEVRGIMPEWVAVPACVMALPPFGFLGGWWFSMLLREEK